jgi:hypothetical protein
MTEYPAGRGYRSSDFTPRLRLAALTAVILGVLLLAAAAFLLSYSGIHHIALEAGVSPKLARFYPGIFDAMLVIASASVLALRGAGWLTRVYVWACLILLLAAVATGDAVHAMGVALPRQPSRAGVAITPWALVLLSFGLLLAMLRHLRRARAAGREQARVQALASTDPPGRGVSREGLESLLEPRTGEPPALPTAEHTTHAGVGGDAGVGGHAVTAAQPHSGSYPPAGGYFGTEGPDETEEYLGSEGYGMEDYAEEYPAADAERASEQDGDHGAGQPPGTQDGDEEAQDSSGPATPASAPPGPFDRMHSSPTRPEE